jgi:hypothetical protein
LGYCYYCKDATKFRVRVRVRVGVRVGFVGVDFRDRFRVRDTCIVGGGIDAIEFD